LPKYVLKYINWAIPKIHINRMNRQEFFLDRRLDISPERFLHKTKLQSQEKQEQRQLTYEPAQ
jgi:hypothetical protein